MDNRSNFGAIGGSMFGGIGEQLNMWYLVSDAVGEYCRGTGWRDEIEIDCGYGLDGHHISEGSSLDSCGVKCTPLHLLITPLSHI